MVRWRFEGPFVSGLKDVWRARQGQKAWLVEDADGTVLAVARFRRAAVDAAAVCEGERQSTRWVVQAKTERGVLVGPEGAEPLLLFRHAADAEKIAGAPSFLRRLFQLGQGRGGAESFAWEELWGDPTVLIDLTRAAQDAPSANLDVEPLQERTARSGA